MAPFFQVLIEVGLIHKDTNFVSSPSDRDPATNSGGSETSVAVITVTLNCERTILKLVESLMHQTDQSFKWIVVDGGSSDGTLETVLKFPRERLVLISEPDFGIYDALNKGVRACREQFYLVAGGDDELYPNAIEKFRNTAALTGADIVAAAVDLDKRRLYPGQGRRWLKGGNAYVASHAIGSLIRRSTHESCGLYSNRYPNSADMLFILESIAHGARLVSASFAAGRFGSAGISSQDRICSLSDMFRIQLASGENRFLQFLIYILRLGKLMIVSAG